MLNLPKAPRAFNVDTPRWGPDAGRAVQTRRDRIRRTEGQVGLGLRAVGLLRICDPFIGASCQSDDRIVLPTFQLWRRSPEQHRRRNRDQAQAAWCPVWSVSRCRRRPARRAVGGICLV